MDTYFHIQKQLDHFLLDIEYKFQKGVLVIQGESGAGKTTVLNCLSGIATPDKGKILLGETTLFDSSSEKVNVPVRKRKIGYVFQNYALFPNLTVEKNISYGLKNMESYKNKEARQELLAYMGYVMKLFQIEHLKGKSPLQISGGEKQRVALARAIVTRPKLLLLDEPFSALDQQTKKLIYGEFGMFKEKFSIPTILITHSQEEAELFADEIIYMKDGKLRS